MHRLYLASIHTQTIGFISRSAKYGGLWLKHSRAISLYAQQSYNNLSSVLCTLLLCTFEVRLCTKDCCDVKNARYVRIRAILKINGAWKHVLVVISCRFCKHVRRLLLRRSVSSQWQTGMCLEVKIIRFEIEGVNCLLHVDFSCLLVVIDRSPLTVDPASCLFIYPCNEHATALFNLFFSQIIKSSC